MERAENIAATARSEGAFAEAARRYSATPPAPRGGRLDWMQVDNMPPSLRGIVLGLKPGQMTPPLTVPGAVVMFYLRDTKGQLRPSAAEQTLDYLAVTYAPCPRRKASPHRPAAAAICTPSPRICPTHRCASRPPAKVGSRAISGCCWPVWMKTRRPSSIAATPPRW